MKEQLIDNLKKTLNLLSENEKLNNEHIYYYKDVFDLPFALFVVLYLVLLFFNYKFINLTDKIFNYSGIFLWISFIFLVGMPLLILNIVPKKVNEYMVNKKLDKNRDRINEIKEKYNFNLKVLEANSSVPKPYWSSYAVNSFINYFENLRADSLKEAINLFEQDQQHIQRMNQLRNIQQQQQHMLIEVREATRAARDAEFAAWVNL